MAVPAWMRSSVHRKEFTEIEQENQFNYKRNQKKEAKIRSFLGFFDSEFRNELGQKLRQTGSVEDVWCLAIVRVRIKPCEKLQDDLGPELKAARPRNMTVNNGLCSLFQKSETETALSIPNPS
ncbi:hypothetical protein E5288_WYG004550 [Bos mutus]|uniref:Uncharacterized protein n=1 Tax=Bos mutus TaxID=72004 RepID=A0A6B0RUS7_9CETA|nr:hypothetical protein [Bos mutus]